MMAVVALPKGWQDEILEHIESGIDPTQIEAQLRLTPTERLERMRRVLESLEHARLSDGNRLQSAARSSRRP
jgi:hypothetical protein